MDIYTHDFKVKLGDGGQFIEGEIEFNTDNKISYKMTSWSEPIRAETLKSFNEICETIRVMFEQYGGIKIIRFKEKGQT